MCGESTQRDEWARPNTLWKVAVHMRSTCTQAEHKAIINVSAYLSLFPPSVLAFLIAYQCIYPTYTPHSSSWIEFVHYANAEKPPNENELPEQAWATRLAWLRCSWVPLRWPQHAHCLIAERGWGSGRGAAVYLRQRSFSKGEGRRLSSRMNFVW